ncbi:glycolate oxidase iron-sulfur subunit [Thermotomaculum hydrothermale]|uniref:Glycolate oxidase iron-sulfur subunit n=1 Tax=Thermotomaculum hydrothermale TaxID=981385 RepID=A0A7R6PG13_9BACT|nr:(Fe-S)-binding protein [Thermotomaculum hydrothermale]BBB33063.1 glycolate oxidase iron-sulfur subunit [Thermotomaculum hydrothermale]
MSRNYIKQQLDLCVKCGNCRYNCPVFQTTLDEGGVARGKISLLQLLLKEDEKFSEETLYYLDSCVVCGSCQCICPRDVDYLSIIEFARAKAVKDNQISRLKKAFLSFLKSNKNLKLASFAKNLFSRKSGLVFKLPKIERHFPLPEKPLDKKVLQYNKPEGEKKFDVLFFPGCATRFIFSDTGMKLIKVLNKSGVGVYFEESLKCCGFPHLTAGDKDTFEELKSFNLKIFEKYKEKVKYIVSGCATCGSNLSRNYELPIEFIDINPLLFDVLNYKPQKKLDIDTYFHHPCHLMKHQGVKNQPEKLLDSVSNRKKLEGEDFCCGFGGSFSIFEAEKSKKIGDKKIDLIKKSINGNIDKSVVVTSCPGCIMQLNDSLKRNNLPIKTVHIIDLIYSEMEE